MQPIEITQEMYDEKEAYCDFKNFPKHKPFLDVCKDDPVLFLTHMLGLKPWTWQFIVLRNYMQGKRKMAVCCSRQVGKSKILIAGLTLWRHIFNKGYENYPTYRNKNKNTFDTILSVTDEQAANLIDEIKQLIKDGDEYLMKYRTKEGKPMFGEKWFTSRVNLRNSTQETIRGLKTEYTKKAINQIKSFPPTTRFRGTTSTGLIIDEAAFVDTSFITKVAQPTVRAIGDTQLFVSTPDRPDGFFYEIIDPDDKYDSHDFERYMFTIECIAIDDPEYYSKVKMDINRMLMEGKHNEVMQEYYCSFVSSTANYFPLDLVKKAMRSDIAKVSGDHSVRCVLGIDVGGMKKSHTVLTVSTHPDDEGVIKRIGCWRYPIKEEGNVIADIEQKVLPFFNITAIVVDQCPAATIIIQQMRSKGWNVVEFNFNKKSKEEAMSKFRSKISRQKFLTYEDGWLYEEFVNYSDDMKPLGNATDDGIDSWMLSTVPFLDEKEALRAYVIGGDNDDLLASAKYAQTLEKYKNHFQGLPQTF
jgi:hypothetical protein